MTNTDSTTSYPDHVAMLLKRHGSEEALRQAVGGEFVAMGKLEYYLLRSLGLSDGHLIIDVGCGSGRLAYQLAPYKKIKYIGTDVVPELLAAARTLTGRNDWQFVKSDGAAVPCADAAADYAVFFSVFTHLLHEETYRYFLEAHRVLKPGGCLVFSFLEFRIACHWAAFMGTVADTRPGRHLNQFIDRDGIRGWAERAGFLEPEFFDGDRGHIPIPEEIVWEDGRRMASPGNLGQSVAVVRKPRSAP